MSITLREKYDNRKLNALVEKLNHKKIIIEVLSDENIQKTKDAMNKLKSIKGKSTSLDTAIDNAEKDVLNNKLKTPLVFAGMIEQGFKQLPEILYAYAADEETLTNEKNRSVSDIVTDKNRLKVIMQKIIDAFTPDSKWRGFLSKIGSNKGVIPYINDLKIFSKELLDMEISTLIPLVGITNKIRIDTNEPPKDVATQPGTETQQGITDEPKQTTGTAPAIEKKKSKKEFGIGKEKRIALRNELKNDAAKNGVGEISLKTILKLLDKKGKLKEGSKMKKLLTLVERLNYT